MSDARWGAPVRQWLWQGLSVRNWGWILVVALALLGLGTPVEAAAGEGAYDITADADGVLLDITLDPFSVALVDAPDGQAYARIALAGFDSTGQAGHPSLPVRGFLLAAPPGAQLIITTTVLAEQVSQASAALYPAPGQVLDETGEDAGYGGTVREVFSRDAAAYDSPTWAPAEPVVLEEAGILRGVRLVRLSLWPVQYRAVSNELRFLAHIRVEVRFVGAAAAGAAADPSDAGGFTDLLRQNVINPDYVTRWLSRPAGPTLTVATAADADGLPLDRTRYRITLRETGIYRLTRTDLENAGLPVDTLDPRRLSLYHGDDELAIEVVGEADGRFDADDVVQFYAEQVQSLYTETNTVWLAIGDSPGRRMATRSVAPAGGTAALSFPDTQHFEVNRSYRSAMPMASDVDHWYWGQMFSVGAAKLLTMTLPFTLAHPLPSGSALLAVELWGASSDVRVAPDHHVRASINGVAIGDIRWDGTARVLAQLSFDQGLLQPGSNTLALHMPADTGARDAYDRPWEVDWLNFFRVTYNRQFEIVDDRLAFTPAPGPGQFAIGGWTGSKSLAYDVTDPTTPVRLEGAVMVGASGNYALHMADSVAAGGRYVVLAPAGAMSPLGVEADAPSGLRTAVEGADYLVIAHADFVAGLQPLVEHRRNQGLRVRVIDVQDIYDEFSGGLLDPHAIRAFIGHAYFNWPTPAPSYVVLAGDGTYDFMDREGYGAKTFVPPFLAAVDPLMGETAADNRYVAVDGGDILPDLHLGRFPVNNQDELAAMVNKIVAYEAAPETGDWRTKAVFVADNSDAAGQFGALADSAAAYMPPEFTVQRIYLGTAEYPVDQAVRAQQATLDAYNAGALLFNFVGHSSVSSWAAELLFGTSVLPQVNNGGKLPIVLPMTCLEGTYHHPRYTGLGESVVRLAGKGAAASWSPTGQGVAGGHDYLHQGFYDALFNWGAYVLGEATTAGLLYLHTYARFPDGSPRYQDLIDTYVLLGDPATHIGLGAANLSLTATGTPGPLAAGDPVTYTVYYSNTNSVRVKGIQIAADLPGGLTNVTWDATGPALSLRTGTSLAWDLGELAPGVSGQISISGVVASELPPGSLPFAAEMRISSRWTEADTSDNRAGPLVTELAPADLLLSQVIEPGRPVTLGELVTFTLSYANLGPAVATGISLTLPLPVGLDDLRVLRSGPVATLRAGSTYTWNLAAMLPGEKGRLTVIGRIPRTLTWAQVFWTVAPRIGATWPDANLDNNSPPTGNIVVEVGDAFEPDDSPAQASRMTPSPVAQPRAYDTVGDQDWIVFRAQAGRRYLVRTLNLGGDGDTVLYLYDGTGKLLAKNDDAAPDTRASALWWQAPADQDYYIMATSNNPLAGFSYQLQVVELPYSTALPLIRRLP